MRHLFSFVFVVTAVAVAYDFSDPFYNQLLAEDLTDILSSQSRFRRDADEEKCGSTHKFFKPKLCCGHEIFSKIREEDKEMKRTCFKEITGHEKVFKPMKRHFPLDPFDCESAMKHREEIICVFQCIGQKKELVDEDGNLQEGAAIKYLEGVLSEASYLDSVKDEIINTCIEEAKNSEIIKSNDANCNPADAKLQHCLYREIQLSCPVDQIKDEQACNILRKVLSKESESHSEESE